MGDARGRGHGKKIKNLKKKLKQIDELEQKLKAGASLNEDQQGKIDAKAGHGGAQGAEAPRRRRARECQQSRGGRAPPNPAPPGVPADSGACEQAPEHSLRSGSFGKSHPAVVLVGSAVVRGHLLYFLFVLQFSDLGLVLPVLRVY